VYCSFLFVQSLKGNKVVQHANVPGHKRPGDIGTKGLRIEAIVRNLTRVSGQFREGRPALCPKAVRCLVLRTDLEGSRSEGGVRKAHLISRDFVASEAGPGGSRIIRCHFGSSRVSSRTLCFP
jgi:hypothetical protein